MKKTCGSPNSEWTHALRRLQHHFFDRDIAPFRPLLKAHCLKLTKDPAKAEDLMQEALIRGLALCQICGGPANTQAYVLRSATNLWIDELRKSQRAQTAMSTLAVTHTSAAHELAEPLLEAMANDLPQREFEALMLTAVYGYTGPEAAELLGTTPSAIKMAASRARKKLRDREETSGSDS